LGVIASLTVAASGERPSAIAFTTMSRSVMIPTSLREPPDSTTGTDPTSFCFMMFATVVSESPG
jgi:hypothetical protein